MLNSEEPTGHSTPQATIRVCDNNKKHVTYKVHNEHNSQREQQPEQLQHNKKDYHHTANATTNNTPNTTTTTTTKKKLEFNAYSNDTFEFLNSTHTHNSDVQPGMHVCMSVFFICSLFFLLTILNNNK